MAHRSPSASQTLGSALKLTEHQVLIFDVYGTLIDWESAIHDAFVHLFPNLTREEILLNYAGVEGNLQMQFPNVRYSKLLALAYRHLATRSGVTMAGVAGGGLRWDEPASTPGTKELSVTTSDSPVDDAQRFGESISDWKPFPDTINALHRLKKHFALVVLSNVDDRSFSGTHEKLCSPDYPGSAYDTVTPESPFSLILTAEQVGAYKPNPAMLESALRQLSASPDPSLPSNPSIRVDASQILVVANSIRHDIIPATERKLRSVWISRNGVNFIGNEHNIAGYHSAEDAASSGIYGWHYEALGRMADAVERSTVLLG